LIDGQSTTHTTASHSSHLAHFFPTKASFFTKLKHKLENRNHWSPPHPTDERTKSPKRSKRKGKKRKRDMQRGEFLPNSLHPPQFISRLDVEAIKKIGYACRSKDPTNGSIFGDAKQVPAPSTFCSSRWQGCSLLYAFAL